MADTTQHVELEKSLGLLEATTIVMGSMIGSGIFIVSADIARQTQSPGLLLCTWIATALLTLIAALSYGELAAAMPHAGGQYVYLREAFGPLPGFLYGWTMFLVIQTGTIAAVAVAFAKFASVFFPWISPDNVLLSAGPLRLTAQQLVGIAVLIGLTWINTRGVRLGAMVQNVFTIAKTGALLGLILLGVLAGRNSDAVARNFSNFWGNSHLGFDALRVIGVAMVGSLFSSDSWNNVTFAAAEIRNPRRNVPLALGLGVSIVSALYLASNWVYLTVLPFDAIQSAPQDRVGTAVGAAILGPIGVSIMAAAIMVSTFGCVNGLVLAGARVYFAMANDGLFFRQAAHIHPERRTPDISLWAQCLWACLLTLSGSYGDLLDYVIFAVLLFYVMTIAGIFVLRAKRPGMERPYRAIGYPLLPALYIALASTIEVLLLMYKPSYTWPGLLIVLTGIPAFLFWRKKEA
ncbi:MAG: amino acid permease [Bryobacteraceae bacterium]